MTKFGEDNRPRSRPIGLDRDVSLPLRICRIFSCRPRSSLGPRSRVESIYGRSRPRPYIYIFTVNTRTR